MIQGADYQSDSWFINLLPTKAFVRVSRKHGTNSATSLTLFAAQRVLRMAWFFTLVLYSFVLLEVEGSHRKRHRCHSRGGTASVGGIKIHHCWSGWSSTSSGGSSCSGVSQGLTSAYATLGEGPLGSRYSDASRRYKCFSPPVARSYTGGYGRWVQPSWLLSKYIITRPQKHQFWGIWPRPWQRITARLQHVAPQQWGVRGLWLRP